MASYFSKKATTMPVAMALALMMVLAASTAISFWVTRLQGQEQGSVESSQNALFENLASCIDIPQLDFNTLDNTSNVAVQNCGNKKLDIGDSLLQDNGAVSGPPCSFVINASTCDKCPFTLDINSFKTFKILWNQTSCMDKITKGKKHQVVLYIDNKATRAKTFVPEAVVECGVTMTNQTNITRIVNTTSQQAFFNFTVKNTGNSQDAFSITNVTARGTCGTQSGGVYDASWVGIKNIVLGGQATGQIYHNVSANTACNTTVTVTSTNCASKSASIAMATTVV